MPKDYYNILGIPRNATKEDIKKAYRKLAHQYHPDKTKGEDKKFKEINEAYQILSDDKKRSEYDTYGRTFEGQGAGGFGGAGFGGFEGFSAKGGPSSGWDFDFSAQGVDFDIGDIFDNFFWEGDTRSKTRKKRGRDISIDLEISFEEAVFGTERRVLLSKMSLCDKCHGTGAEPGAETQKCPICQGAGRVHETKKSFLGSFTTLRECTKCAGKGTIPSQKCGQCKGAGVLPKREEVTIKIPAGIQNGEMIKLSAMGEAVDNGISGDLYAKIYVARHSVFKREGGNLLMDLDIKISEALLGAERDIKTLDGMIKLKIPAGIDSGEILRVRGKGVPHQNSFHGGQGGRGDLMIKIFIRTPKKISTRAKKIIDELKQEGI